MLTQYARSMQCESMNFLSPLHFRKARLFSPNALESCGIVESTTARHDIRSSISLCVAGWKDLNLFPLRESCSYRLDNKSRIGRTASMCGRPNCVHVGLTEGVFKNWVCAGGQCGNLANLANHQAGGTMSLQYHQARRFSPGCVLALFFTTWCGHFQVWYFGLCCTQKCLQKALREREIHLFGYINNYALLGL